VFRWHVAGDVVTVGPLRPGVVDLGVTARVDREAMTAELPAAGARALLEWLREHLEDETVEQLEHALGVTEQERDELVERVKTLEGELRGALGQLETLKSAHDLDDQRVRAAEDERDAALLRADGLGRDVERMRSSAQPLEHARATLAARRAGEGLS